MCLLKQSDRDTNCGHNECKNFYMLNKQMCMYNINQQPQAANTQNVAISAIHPQIQLSSLLSQKPNTFITSQPSLNVKRQANPANESDQETFFFNKKQIKPDVDESKNEDPNQTNFQNNLSDLNILSQQILNQNSGDRNSQQAQFINGINPTNGQICYIKQDNPGMQFAGSAIYIPVVQQGNMSSNQSFTPLVANGQNGFNVVNGAQLFSQNMRIKPTSNNNNIVNVSSINLGNIDTNNRANNNTNTPSSNSTNTQNSTVPIANGVTAVEAVMKEFQSRISELLLSQNKMLIDLKEKNEVIQDTLACLINEMSSLKSAIKQTPQEKISAGPITSLLNNIAVNSNEVATTESLLHYLYGPNQDFHYQLLMKNPLSLPLYRERNFKFTLLLTDKTGNPIENSNKIPLTIAIYSSESVPKYIDANTAGNKILKGFIDKDMINGTVTFDKIQIKEVTSHFRNGWVFFVVYPKVSNAGGNILGAGRDNVIAAQKIRPFIIEKVIVKAKKAKEKETEEPEEDVFQQEEESETQVQMQPTEENPKQEIPVKA